MKEEIRALAARGEGHGVRNLPRRHPAQRVGQLLHALEQRIAILEGQSLNERIERLEKENTSPVVPSAATNTRNLVALCDELVTLGIEEANRQRKESYPFIVSLVERRLIERILNACGGIQTQAADRLGINRNTLRKKLEEFGIENPALDPKSIGERKCE